MSLADWITNFYKLEFSKPVESTGDAQTKGFDWPDGTAMDPLKPYWVEETGKTYETLEAAVDEMDGRMPSDISFGVVKFDA